MPAVNQRDRRNAFLRFLLVFLIGMGLTAWGVSQFGNIHQVENQRLTAENQVLTDSLQNQDTTFTDQGLTVKQWSHEILVIKEGFAQLKGLQREWKNLKQNGLAGIEEAAQKELEISQLEQKLDRNFINLLKFFSASDSGFYDINENLGDIFREYRLFFKNERDRMKLELAVTEQASADDALAQQNADLQTQIKDMQQQNQIQAQIDGLRGKLTAGSSQLAIYAQDLAKRTDGLIAEIDDEVKWGNIKTARQNLKTKAEAISSVSTQLQTLAATMTP